MLIYSIEDDADIALIINKTLTKSNYTIKIFESSRGFFEAMEEKIPDIILLDLMLPGISGIEILRRIRTNSLYHNIRIIVVSAKHMIKDKVEALSLGADDYIEKPFDLLELIARVNAQARRIEVDKEIKIGNIVINSDTRECRVNNQVIELTLKEFEILYLLMHDFPNVVSREDIFEKIWQTQEKTNSRTIDMHVKSLRSKIDSTNITIQSVYGIGYKICEEN